MRARGRGERDRRQTRQTDRQTYQWCTLALTLLSYFLILKECCLSKMIFTFIEDIFVKHQ